VDGKPIELTHQFPKFHRSQNEVSGTMAILHQQSGAPRGFALAQAVTFSFGTISDDWPLDA
jgi:hypothetical protein